MPNANAQREAVLAAVSERNLSSVMNNTRWNRLIEAVRTSMPFPPPYQRKDILSEGPFPANFEDDVPYHGDWGSALRPYHSIEWLRVRPRYQKPQGQLVAPEIVDESERFLAIVRALRLPHRVESDCVWIYGYAPTGLL